MEDFSNTFNYTIAENNINTKYKNLNIVYDAENEVNQMLKNICVKRGEIYLANLTGNIDSEQGGLRPVLIMQNDVGNNVSTITTVLPITSKINKNMMPTHVKIGIDTGLTMLSEITTEQVRSISKRRLLINGYVKKIGCLNNEQMNQVEEALSKQLGMKSLHYDNEFAEQLIKNIVITNQHIKKFNNTSLRPVLNFFYMELKKYCDSYNINYKDAIEMYLCKRKNINTNNIIFSKEKAM